MLIGRYSRWIVCHGCRLVKGSARPGMHLRTTTTACLLVLLVSPGLAAERPSFDCAKAASASETAICGSDRLARLDRAMAAAYRQLKAELASIDDGALGAEQAAFLAQRDACGTAVACLAARMEERRAALALEPKQ